MYNAAEGPKATPAEESQAPETPPRPTALVTESGKGSSGDVVCFPAGKLEQIVNPEHPAFVPDAHALKQWQV